MKTVYELGKGAKEASRFLAVASTEDKNRALLSIASALEENCEKILEKNRIDMEAAKNSGINPTMLDRLLLTKERIKGMADGVREVVSLPDPVGRTLDSVTRPNGLEITKVSVPIGVIAVIFEARPNVTSDAASLCLKAGNCVILRGGKEAINSNTEIALVMRNAVKKVGFPEDCINFVEDVSRQSATDLMTLNEFVDVLIPRGGAGLIQACVKNATVPVIETGTGNCHIYVDKSADIEMAAKIVFNAKTSRPSVCNAAESLLIHKDIISSALPIIKKRLDEKDVTLHGDETSRKICPDILPATDEDWGKEYLSFDMSVKCVESTEEAIDWIYKYGTKHSESIITEDKAEAEKFLNNVDAAAVYHNASTRFTDGGVFGLGAEIGISTQKLHARGPLGLNELTSMKFVVRGDGQIR
ncbi:MAG: glutamate-5-semialdehyde dehydrogenase [Ruminococcaceae bacterium]|nr:glutamate-5-semialdehyde dehydrogenase [Oscillospiraceae bacterium]